MLEDILSAHFAAYPKMQPQDAVKLIYQGEFGPGHMIGDLRKAAQYLHEEMERTVPDEKQPLYEAIGNGLCRLNLAACKHRGIPEPVILRLFCDAAATTKGDKKQFRHQLYQLKAMAQRDETPFEAIALDLFLVAYDEKRCPAVHHSAAYQTAYHPAYRVVVQKKLRDELKALRQEKKADEESK